MKKRKVLVVAVHPDDETLGCGGTLIKHQHNGDSINWLIITGITTENGYDAKWVQSRAEEIDQVARKYNFDKVIQLNLPPMQLDTIPKSDFISKISAVFKEMEPEVIYLQHYGDAHSDHKFAFDAIYSCTKSFRFPFVKEVYTMETLSETEFSAPSIANAFIPNTYVDISSFIDQKIEIMQVFSFELGEHPFPRSRQNIKALATYRGSQCNAKYAEAFCCLKRIVD